MKLVFLAVALILCSSIEAFKFRGLPRHVNGQLPNGGKIWVVLVAGSNTYDNYRHQSDVCHAYQIHHKNGIPDEQIIVFMYDDIANSDENPNKGVIINHIGGDNVYPGVPKDYIGDDCNVDVFLKVLAGNQAGLKGVGSGKVLASGPNDYVFIYYADHGAEGLVAFPVGDYLYSDQLQTALKDLHDNQKFDKLVFYMEACESGSMFNGILPADINIYAATASTPDESSYATYWDDDLSTYLGDEFSVAWMEDSDASDISKETLQTQFDTTKKNTPSSSPQQYGDLTIAQNFFVAQFQGNNGVVNKRAARTAANAESVDVHDVPLRILEKRLKKAKSTEEIRSLLMKLAAMKQKRSMVDNTVKRIVKLVGSNDAKVETLLTAHTRAIDSMSCYKRVVNYFTEKCFSQSPYALKHMQVFANMCNHGINAGQAKKAIDHTCVNVVKNVN